MNNQVEVVFKQELRGRNALHFWLGFAAICFGIWLWLNGWFSAFAVETNFAPERLEESFQARAAEGFMGPATNGYGSTGVVSLLFDTVCLIGWGTAFVLLLMRKGLAAVLERLGFVTGGLYSWASRQRESGSQGLPDQFKAQLGLLERKVAKSVRNHEERLRIVEGKTAEMPEPEPPPEPKTAEELLKEQAEELAELRELTAKLKEEVDKKPTASRTRSRTSTKK